LGAFKLGIAIITECVYISYSNSFSNAINFFS